MADATNRLIYIGILPAVISIRTQTDVFVTQRIYVAPVAAVELGNIPWSSMGNASGSSCVLPASLPPNSLYGN